MKLFISLIIVWTVSGTTLAAANDLKSFGDLRLACKDAMAKTGDNLAKCYCYGWLWSESSSRNILCKLAEDAADVLGPFGLVTARKTEGHSMGAMMQGFLNWADANPQVWSRPIFHGIVSNDFWSEFPCEAAN